MCLGHAIILVGHMSTIRGRVHGGANGPRDHPIYLLLNQSSIRLLIEKIPLKKLIGKIRKNGSVW
jgi:hypothetical protein